jgi:lysophospholipase L1-like esterase
MAGKRATGTAVGLPIVEVRYSSELSARPETRWLLAIVFGAAVAAGCGSPTAPSNPPAGPTLSCPASQTVTSLTGVDQPVTFPLPTAGGGTPPIAVTCAPVSGSLFSVGTSKVTCTGIDARQQIGMCTFDVTVQGPPKLSATRFVAFGDSITEGKIADGTLLPNNGYVGDLSSLLAARYLTQTTTVAERGCGGETAGPFPPSVVAAGQVPTCSTPDGGVARLARVLASDNPQVVLLLEGVNDLTDGGGDPSAIAPMVAALRSMIDESRIRGARVFLATLLPARATGTPSARGRTAMPLIPAANDQIRQLAASQGEVLVDLYQGFNGNPDPYIDTDGLHPNALGYEKIAELFFDAIRTNLETTSAQRMRTGRSASVAVRR